MPHWKNVKLDNRLHDLIKKKAKMEGSKITDELNLLVAGTLGKLYKEILDKDPTNKGMMFTLQVLAQTFGDYEKRLYKKPEVNKKPEDAKNQPAEKNNS